MEKKKEPLLRVENLVKYYPVKGGVITPDVDHNWKLVGNDWEAAKHAKAVELVRAGKLYVNEDPTSRNLPSKVITEADLAAAEA